MINWNGVSVSIDSGVSKIMEAAKAKKTTIWVIAGVIALGVILFLKGK
jgi:hypothetical protein